MYKIFAVVLIGAGIAIGVVFGEDIKSAIEGDPYENARESVEDAAGDLADKAGDLIDSAKDALE